MKRAHLVGDFLEQACLANAGLAADPEHLAARPGLRSGDRLCDPIALTLASDQRPRRGPRGRIDRRRRRTIRLYPADRSERGARAFERGRRLRTKLTLQHAPAALVLVEGFARPSGRAEQLDNGSISNRVRACFSAASGVALSRSASAERSTTRSARIDSRSAVHHS